MLTKDKTTFLNSILERAKKLIPSQQLILCMLIVFIFYSFTLNRPWIIYDEDFIYKEIYVPIASSFNEIFEILGLFGLVNNFTSGNFIYSSNSVVRTNIFDLPILMFIAFLFKKNAFSYHLLNLILHISCTLLVFLILKKWFSYFAKLNLFLISILTLIWALHPVHVETVLLATNIGPLISYLTFFILFYDFLCNKEKNTSLIRRIILPLIFLFTMLRNELIATLPMLLFIFVFFEGIKNKSLKTAFITAWQQTLPYLIGLFLYIFYFLFSNYSFYQLTQNNFHILTLERIFWLAPQIITHHLKLIFYPKELSIDASAYIKIARELLDPYPITCLLLMIIFLLIPPTFFIWKKRGYILNLTTWLLFVSLIPFSQIAFPTYTLAQERYLYIPCFILIFGFTAFCAKYLQNKLQVNLIASTLVITLLILGTRAFIRTQDWKDSYTLISSAIESSPQKLYKAFRIKDLYSFFENKPEAIKKLKLADSLLVKQIKTWEAEKKKYQNEPLILKAYGLDLTSLIIKATYQLCYYDFSRDKNNYKQCLELFNPLVKYIDYFDSRALELYANLLIENGNINGGKDVFEYAHDKYPNHSFILISLIRLYRDIEKNTSKAKDYLLKARQLYPYSKDILFEALRYYQAAQDLEEYLYHAYLYGLRAHSKFAYLEALKGFLSLKKMEEGKRTVEKLINLDANDPTILYIASKYYIQTENYKKAIELLDQGLSLVRTSGSNLELGFDITHALSKLFMSLGDTQQALYYAKEALSFANSNPGNVAKIKKLLDELGV